MSTLLVMAGGTGGHLYPALAVAQCLRGRGVRVVWLGTRQGPEARVVPENGFDIEWIGVQGIVGGDWRSRLLGLLRLPMALWQVLAVVRRRRPALFFGTGGFVSGPGGIAAWLLRRPLIIHESNTIPGLTNRILQVLARRVLTGFPAVLEGRRTEAVGNPVRTAILSIAAPELRLAGRGGPLRVLVVGGSRGADIFNQTLPAALAQSRIAAEVRHQCGRGNAAAVNAAYKRYGGGGDGSSVRVTEFIDDMADSYHWSDLVVCRSGAMTISELAASGSASLLVPFPYAAGDHQSINAEWLCAAGAALKLPQNECTAAKLGALLQEVAADRGRLMVMARRARDLAAPAATARIADICMEVMYA